MTELIDLFWQFMVFSVLAFGGGGTVIGLVDRVAVADKDWITPVEFSAAVGFTFVTPGPILVLAPFVGYLVAGISGAAVATVGVFIVPWALAMGAAHRLRHYLRHPRLTAFGKGAGATIVGAVQSGRANHSAVQYLQRRYGCHSADCRPPDGQIEAPSYCHLDRGRAGGTFDEGYRVGYLVTGNPPPLVAIDAAHRQDPQSLDSAATRQERLATESSGTGIARLGRASSLWMAPRTTPAAR